LVWDTMIDFVPITIQNPRIKGKISRCGKLALIEIYDGEKKMAVFAMTFEQLEEFCKAVKLIKERLSYVG